MLQAFSGLRGVILVEQVLVTPLEGGVHSFRAVVVLGFPVALAPRVSLPLRLSYPLLFLSPRSCVAPFPSQPQVWSVSVLGYRPGAVFLNPRVPIPVSLCPVVHIPLSHAVLSFALLVHVLLSYALLSLTLLVRVL